MLQFFGQFHPAVTHFPIALLLVAMGTEAISWAARKPALHRFGAWNLLLGTMAAVFAAALGWALAASTDVENAMKETLLWHRWIGTAAAVWAVLSLAAWLWHQRQPSGARLALYRFALLAGGVLGSRSTTVTS